MAAGAALHGGHIGSKAIETHFVAPMVDQWVHGVEVLSRIAVKHPQAVYHGFATLLQAEWQYMSHTVPGLRPTSSPSRTRSSATSSRPC